MRKYNRRDHPETEVADVVKAVKEFDSWWDPVKSPPKRAAARLVLIEHFQQVGGYSVVRCRYSIGVSAGEFDGWYVDKEDGLVCLFMQHPVVDGVPDRRRITVLG